MFLPPMFPPGLFKKKKKKPHGEFDRGEWEKGKVSCGFVTQIRPCRSPGFKVKANPGIKCLEFFPSSS